MKKEYINKMLTAAKQDIDDALAALEKTDTKSFECHLQMAKDAIKCASNMHCLSRTQAIMA
jgi:cellobiose-specific phosphotransferase system component IIA